MFGKRSQANDLEVPPIAKDPAAVEILRVWAAPGKPQQLTLRTMWGDAGAWGLMLADIARHAAHAYAAEGKDPTATLARIRALFDAEWEHPTDDAREVTPRK